MYQMSSSVVFAADGERDQLRRSGLRVPVSEADYPDLRRRPHSVPFADWKGGFHGHFFQVPSRKRKHVVDSSCQILSNYLINQFLFVLQLPNQTWTSGPEELQPDAASK